MPPKKERRLILLRRHIARLERHISRLDAVSQRFSWARIGLVLVGASLAYVAFQASTAAAGWGVVVAFGGGFVLVARRHGRVENALARFRRWRQIKTRHVARMRLDFDALPAPLPEASGAELSFAPDLNLTGPRSMHHLLDTAASEGGSRRLRTWLLEPVPEREAAARRQQLVRELAGRDTFRDRLALLGMPGTGEETLDDDRWSDPLLMQWIRRDRAAATLRPWVIGLGALAVLNMVLAIGHLAGGWPPLWPFTLMAYLTLYYVRYHTYGALFDEAQDLREHLGRVVPPLLHLEGCSLAEGSQVANHLAPLRTGAARPSSQLRRLDRIAAAASFTTSEALWVVFNVLVPWDLFFTYLLHRAKAELRTHLPEWLDRWYDMEALCALAAFADYQPDRAFPEIKSPAAGPPAFDGRGLGHPLLPEEQKIRNDFALARPGEVTLVTGSNMSGKSTFLRTLGVNLRLAYAGTVVDAEALQAVPLRVFTCMNVSDSVQEGLSYFYAEVKRLKALLVTLRERERPPLFFLVDEIFRGTNNRERLIGSRAYLRALAGSSGLGLIATHDLELTGLAAEMPELRNVHFREEVTGRRMTFDYRLREGPCPTTNALKIMENEGLPVEREPSEGKTSAEEQAAARRS